MPPRYNEFQSSIFGDAPIQQPQEATNTPIPPLTEEEQASLLSRIGGGALHGLGWLGSSLGKAFGGRAIRGALGGKAKELLSIIPFSDTLGITNPEDEVHGSDLLGGNKDSSLFSPEGVGGFALDVATDPLTYLTFGSHALTKLGATASKLGILPKNIAGVGGRVAGFAPGSAEAAMLATGHGAATGTAMSAAEAAGQRLGGHVGLHLPFTGLGTTFDLSGLGNSLLKIPGATPLANAVGSVTAPIGRTFSALFNKEAKGFSDEIFQPIAIANSQKAKAASHAALTEATPIMKLSQEIVGHSPGQVWDAATHGAMSEDLGKKLVMYIEMSPNDGKLNAAQQAILDTIKTNEPKIKQLGDMMIGEYGKELAANQAAGYSDKALEGMGFTHRQATQRPINQGGLGKAWNDLSPEEQVARNKMFQGMYTEGPQSINQFSKDKSILTAADPQKTVRDAYLGVTPADETMMAALKKKAGASTTAKDEQQFASLLEKKYSGNPMSPAERQTLADLELKKAGNITEAERATLAQLEAKWSQAEDLVGWHKKLDHDALEKAGGFFGHHPLAMFEEYKLGQAGRRLNADSAFEVLPKIVEEKSAQGSKSLRGVMQQVGLPIDEINSPAHQKMMAGLDEAISSGNLKVDPALLDANGKLYANAFDKLTVSKENAQKLMGFLNPAQSQAPEAVRPVLALYDSMINLVKAGQTSWPATQARNIISDIYKRWTGGGSPFAPLVDAKNFREGGVIKGLENIPRFKGMTAEQATQKIWEDMYQLGLMDTKKYQAADAVGTGLETIAKTQPVIGAQQPGLWEAAVTKNLPGVTSGKTIGETLNPLNVRGVAGKEESKFLPVAMTQSAQNYFEELNKIATYIDATKRGYNPLAAMEKVVEAHHDFSNLTGFEKNVMRRIVPFYCVPEEAEILTREGWKTHGQLVVGEEVLTYNVDGDILQWQPCEDKFTFQHDQELMRFCSGQRDFLFTPDHRWPVRYKASVKHSYGKYDYEETRVVQGSGLKGTHSFILAANLEADTDSILTPEQSSLLGWALTDGYVRPERRGHVEMVLYQSPKKFLKEAEKAAGNKARPALNLSGSATITVESSRRDEILPYMDHNRLLGVVSRLSFAAAVAMRDAMYLADGNTKNPEIGGHGFSSPPKIVEAFRLLCFMTGKSFGGHYGLKPTIDGQGSAHIYVRDGKKGRFMHAKNGKITRQHYKGIVWCPKTKNGTWVMRQNGGVVITGNSWLKQNIPQVVGEMATNPGGRMAQTMRLMTDAQSRNAFVPEDVGKTGFAIPVGGIGADKKQPFLTSTGLPMEDLGNLFSMQTLMGNTTPALRVPFELATGRSVYGANELPTNYPLPLGGAGSTLGQLGNALLQASPFSRAISQGRVAYQGLADPSEQGIPSLLRLGLGSRTVNVNQEQARRQAVEQYVRDATAGNPLFRQFSNLYTRPEDRARLTPQEMMLLRLYQDAQQNRLSPR